jgi:two-component system alkaline phosphatase synthesis response regulator PhoP
MNKIKILLVDDEPDILEIVSYNLLQEGYDIITAPNGKEAIILAEKYKPQLILLDIMMPEMDGIEACKLIRKNKALDNTIIVFFSAKGADYDQIQGFEAGADDYITKPIKPKVLISKIKGLLRRTKSEKATTIKYNSIEIDRNTFRVIIDTKSFTFPKKEFELIYLLASNPNTIVTREKIMSSVWGEKIIVGGRTIDVHIRKIREKIGSKYIETVKGVGYKFNTNEV